MGISACARSEGARPSQKKEYFQARLKSGIALRAPTCSRTPTLYLRGSEKACFASWQEAQEIVPSLDRAVSRKSFSPSVTRSSVSGLSRGKSGIGNVALIWKRFGVNFRGR